MLIPAPVAALVGSHGNGWDATSHCCLSHAGVSADAPRSQRVRAPVSIVSRSQGRSHLLSTSLCMDQCSVRLFGYYGFIHHDNHPIHRMHRIPIVAYNDRSLCGHDRLHVDGLRVFKLSRECP